jgi:hypothetical protein
VPGPPLRDALVAVLPLAACCANAPLDRAMTKATTVTASADLIILILRLLFLSQTPPSSRNKRRPTNEISVTNKVGCNARVNARTLPEGAGLTV